MNYFCSNHSMKRALLDDESKAIAFFVTSESYHIVCFTIFVNKVKFYVLRSATVKLCSKFPTSQNGLTQTQASWSLA